jgi:hypothetical protein
MRAATAALAMDQGGAGGARPLAPASFSVRVADRIAPSLARNWASLLTAEPNPFAEPWFVEPSLRALAAAPVRVLEVRSRDSLTGVLLLAEESHYGRIPVAHVQNWTHHHLFLGTPAIRAGSELGFWRSILAHLDGADWAPGFLHIDGLVENGVAHRALTEAAAGAGRSCAVVHREQRAFLCSDLDSRAYYAATVRKKKRKELARLRNRLAELGVLATRAYKGGDDLAEWCDAFLVLERSGWKGRNGSALACHPETDSFFREAVAGAAGAGRLQMLRLDLDDRPLAMLVNFLTPPGAFSFKTAFDEAYARFSPGVLLQLENLNILDRPEIDWMDSCAAADHPMIDGLWGERRNIVRLTIPLRGLRRRTAFAFARTLEGASALRRRLLTTKSRMPA